MLLAPPAARPKAGTTGPRPTTRRRRTSRWCSPAGPAPARPERRGRRPGPPRRPPVRGGRPARSAPGPAARWWPGRRRARSGATRWRSAGPRAGRRSRPTPSSAAYAAPMPATNPAVRSSCRRPRSVAAEHLAPPVAHQVPDQQGDGDEGRPDVDLDRAESGHQPVAGEDLDEAGDQTDNDHRRQRQAGHPQPRRPPGHHGLPRRQHHHAETQQPVTDRGQPRRHLGSGGERRPATEERPDQDDQQRHIGPPAGAAERSPNAAGHSG